MKIDTPVCILLFFVSLACNAPKTVAEKTIVDRFGDIVGDFFGGGGDEKDDPKSEKEDKEAAKKQAEARKIYLEQSLKDNVILGPVWNRMDDYVNGNAVYELSQGERVYRCMNEINSAGGRNRQFSFANDAIESISYGIVYQLFDSDEDIDAICPEETGSRRSLTLDIDGSKNNLRRRNQEETMGMEPPYPLLDTKDVYTGFVFKNSAVTSFLESGDFNNRTAIGVLVDQLNTEIAVYRTVSENLALTSDWFNAIGDFVSTFVPEGGLGFANLDLDIGSSLRGIGGLFETLSTTVARNISRRQRSLDKVLNHRSLIDSAEIEAGMMNTQSLLTEVVSLRQKVQELERRARV